MTDEAAPEPDAPKGLHAKIAAVQKAANVGGMRQRHVEVKNKERTAVQYTYDYIEESTLMTTIRPLLAEYGVAIYYDDAILTLSGNVATVRTTLTLVDGETGEERSMSTEGMAADYGDKMVNKAKTSALRYLLWKWFLVPSSMDDPEVDSIATSERPPPSHVKMAKDEDVTALADEVEAAGFDRAAFQTTVDEENAMHEGVRQAWLEETRRNFEKARKAAQDAAAAKS